MSKWYFLNPHSLMSYRRRLVDRRMLPLLGLLYAVSLVDRTNLGIARVAGMAVDLVRALSSMPISQIC